ncbi:mechanosensitive ion channel domain-containing protein [Algirhabdus cladophorae]|uniref:mechanosensitive ion channel domain-containing protein n=1 Tax=Algirhabdus cladophorae TaxID=3377108 RepID=UPI003B849B97
MVRYLLVCCLLCWAAAASAQVSETQPSGAISVEDSAAQDAAIATRIRGILEELDGYQDVTVTVSNGIVTLRGTTIDTAKAAELNDLVGRVEAVVAIENNVVETTDVVERLNPAVDRFMARINQTVAYLPLAMVALTAFLMVVLLGLLIARFKQPWDRLAPNAFIANIYRTLVRLAFVVGGLVIALDILGAAALLSTILGAAGIIGLAIGFAVKDTVENFIASIMLSIRQPFRPNDTIEIGGDTGKVIRLTSRATILLSFDGNHIRIPNATVFKSRIVNFTRNNERRFTFTLGVAYGTDLAKARDLAITTLADLPFVLKEPAADVIIQDLGDSTVGLFVAAWIAQHETSFGRARGEAIRVLLQTFDQAGIEMPEPTYRLLTSSADQSSDAKPTKPIIAPPMGGQTVAPEQDRQLEKIIAQEREELEDGDLLAKGGQEE